MNEEKSKNMELNESIKSQNKSSKKAELRLFISKLRYILAKTHFVIKNYKRAKQLFKRPFKQSIIFIVHMKKFTAVYKDGRTVSSFNFWKLYTLIAKEFEFKMQDITIKHAEIGACDEVFGGEYQWLPVKNKIVVDVGASIGDSSLYFAFRGAKKVIAIESDNIRFQYLEENVKSSIYANTIKLLKVGLSADCVLSSELDSKQLISLKLISQMFDNNEKAVMKIDCEGCEYDAILNAEENTLSRFSHIVGEYHYDYVIIKNKLESFGFKTIFTKPVFFYDPTKSNPNCMVGNFIAWV
jgi:hypothetical protein